MSHILLESERRWVSKFVCKYCEEHQARKAHTRISKSIYRPYSKFKRHANALNSIFCRRWEEVPVVRCQNSESSCRREHIPLTTMGSLDLHQSLRLLRRMGIIYLFVNTIVILFHRIEEVSERQVTVLIENLPPGRGSSTPDDSTNHKSAEEYLLDLWLFERLFHYHCFCMWNQVLPWWTPKSMTAIARHCKSFSNFWVAEEMKPVVERNFSIKRRVKLKSIEVISSSLFYLITLTDQSEQTSKKALPTEVIGQQSQPEEIILSSSVRWRWKLHKVVWHDALVAVKPKYRISSRRLVMIHDGAWGRQL